MMAYLGEIMFKAGTKIEPDLVDGLDIDARQRTDDVIVDWK
jgi:hypothetical protein